MQLVRGSGILLHPTSLPGPHGSGDIGDATERFLGWLQAAGQRYWQVLPLNPVGYGSSPYSALSAFATNPLLIALDPLVEKGWLDRAALAKAPRGDQHRVNYDAVTAFRLGALRQAAERFFERGEQSDKGRFDVFCQAHAKWLDDYALFMALNDHFGGKEWSSWDPPLAHRDHAALVEARSRFAPQVRFHEFTQWVFHEQWTKVRQSAMSKGIRIIGDIPIFVAFHSADVWAHPEVFHLDEERRPTIVAGVPPDYFSETGQRWGNPLYRWDLLAQTNYAWWIERFQAVFESVDVARIDHFRGFAAYWEIPAAEETAVHGRWVPGPGGALFEAVRNAIGDLPIIAEDLGVITPDVASLRDQFHFPGMKVLQFAFGGGPDNPFLPHNHVKNAVVYTGTHDNDTTRGWYEKAPEHEKDHVRRYLARGDAEIVWELVRSAMGSVCDLALFPLQDVLGFGSEARMNTPGVAAGNWGWRFTWDALPHGSADRLNDLVQLYGRYLPPSSTP